MAWFLPLLIGAGIGAGAGAMTGQGAGKGAMIGAATGGLGGMFGMFGGGASTQIPTAAELISGTAMKATNPMNWGNIAMAGGMGLSAMQAFAGGGATGFAPTTEMKLSPEGEELQKSLFGLAKEQYTSGLMPQNLASIYVGKVKQAEEKTHQAARGYLTSMVGAPTEGGAPIRTGTQVGALLSESQRRMGGLTTPEETRMGLKEEEFRNALIMLENIRDIEKQTPLLRAQSAMYKTLMNQSQRATQGQALGDVARYAAMMKVGF